MAGLAVGLIVACVILVFTGGDSESIVFLPLYLGQAIALLLIPGTVVWALLWIAAKLFGRTPWKFSGRRAFIICAMVSGGAIFLSQLPVIDEWLDSVALTWCYYGMAYIVLPFIVLFSMTSSKSLLSISNS